MMKFLALVVLIAIVVCKGETDTVSRGNLGRESSRKLTIEEATMNDPALQEEITNILLIAFGHYGDDYQAISEYVTNRIRPFSDIVCLILPKEIEGNKHFDYAYTTTDYMRIKNSDKPELDILVFKL